MPGTQPALLQWRGAAEAARHSETLLDPEAFLSSRDLAEKKLGLAAKERLKELCVGNLKVKSLGKGKYGRILGIPYTQDGQDICQMLIDEGHAVKYEGGKKTKIWGDY